MIERNRSLEKGKSTSRQCRERDKRHCVDRDDAGP